MKTRRGLFGTVAQMLLGAMAAPALAHSTPREMLPATGHIQGLKDGAGRFIFQRNGKAAIKADMAAPERYLFKAA